MLRPFRSSHLALAALALLLVPAWVALRAYLDERRCFVPVRHEPRVSTPNFQIEGLRDVSFAAPGGPSLSGVFAPPRNQAAVILTHGSNGERSDLLPEARLLTRAGFGVLAFDWPGHCRSDGPIHWGAGERAALTAAIDFLEKEPGVDRTKLGAFGFSMGGYITAQVAASDARLRAVALASSPNDPLEHLYWEYRRWGVLRQWPALLALELGGMPLHEQVPQSIIARIAPRPLLLVAGREDELVPNWMTRKLFDAAQEPKRLLLVPNAGHGGYADADPGGYPEQLVRFFEGML
jgi:uncharacterized protein